MLNLQITAYSENAYVWSFAQSRTCQHEAAPASSSLTTALVVAVVVGGLLLALALLIFVVSTVRPSKSGSKSCQTWPFLFSKYGYQELVCTRTSGWLYPCVNIHMVVAW